MLSGPGESAKVAVAMINEIRNAVSKPVNV